MSGIVYAGNDFLRTFFLQTVDPTTFAETPVTTGAVEAFLSTTNDDNAVAADSAFNATVTHIGVASPPAGEYPLGTWGIKVDGAGLTSALLNSLFANGVCYLVVVRDGDVRVYERLRVQVSRPAST